MAEALPRRPPPPTIYRSAAGEAAIRALYDKALAALPYEHAERLVETSFGTAHVLVCGPADAPPLVLWSGGEPDQDAELDPAKHEYGKWALEVLRGLGLVPPANADGGKGTAPPPLHMGTSFGAAVVLDLANVAPEAIRGAALVAPGGLSAVNPWAFALRLMLPAVLYRLLPCSLTAWLSLVSVCDEPAAEELEVVLMGWKHIVRYPPLPGGPSGVFLPDQLSRLTAPTIIICGEHDIWPCKATAAAAAALPDCKTIIIPGAKHFPAKQHLIQAADWILDWFAVKGLVPAATK